MKIQSHTEQAEPVIGQADSVSEGTRRPWDINPLKTVEGETMICNGEWAHEYGLIAVVPDAKDAALIVRAVNRDHHYDALVRALEYAIAVTDEDLATGRYEMSEAGKMAYQRAAAALAGAKT